MKVLIVDAQTLPHHSHHRHRKHHNHHSSQRQQQAELVSLTPKPTILEKTHRQPLQPTPPQPVLPQPAPSQPEKVPQRKHKPTISCVSAVPAVPVIKKGIINPPTQNPDHLDRIFYLGAYKDVNPRFVNPFIHYYSIGKQAERLPNAQFFKELYPKFDLEEYQSQNSDLLSFTNEELMSHFHHYGRFECRLGAVPAPIAPQL